MWNGVAKRATAVLAALVLASVMALVPMAAFAADEAQDGELAGKTAVIYTGNIRGDLDQFAKVATVKADYEQQGAEVILVDVGNFYQGTKYAGYDGGETVLKAMREVGYDLVVPGKNDFNFGTNDFGNPYTHAVHHWSYLPLTASLMDTTTLSAQGLPILGVTSTVMGVNDYYQFSAATTITCANGLEVTFTGLTDPTPRATALASAVDGLAFHDGETAINDAINAAGSASTVIALSNLETAPVIDGQLVVNVPAAPYGTPATAGVIVLDESGKQCSSESIDLASTKADASVQALVQEYEVTVDAAFPEDLTIVNELLIDGNRERARFEEAPVGDLFADGMRWFALNDAALSADLAAKGVDASHVIGTINGGNLRDNLYDGQLIECDFDRVECFPNTVSIVYVKGSDLLTQLEVNSYGLGSPLEEPNRSAAASFNQVSSDTSFNVDLTKELDKGDAIGSYWFEAKSVNRVSITSVNGQAFNPEDTYAVVTSDKIANGMDSNYVLRDNALDRTDSSTSVCVAALQYVKSEMAGVISADSAYADAQGRITFVETPVEKKDQVVTTTVDGKVTSKKVYKAKKLKAKNRTFKIVATTSGDGVITYAVAKGSENALKVTSKGKVTVLKGTKAGTYKITVKAKATDTYKKKSKTFKVVVK